MQLRLAETARLGLTYVKFSIILSVPLSLLLPAVMSIENLKTKFTIKLKQGPK